MASARALTALAAVGLLAVVSAGSATAAALITGAQIKNGTVTSLDVKDHTLAQRDLSRGVTGSLAGGRIPSGRTVSGYVRTDLASTVENDFGVTVTLPGTAAKPLTENRVNFGSDGWAATIDDDPACDGSFTAPTAPTGKVCLYATEFAPDTSSLNGTGIGSRTSFDVRWWDDATVVPDVFVVVAWAYTAP